ncbi:MAG: GyrI-like domain-containing protein [Planctomycetota bacterium]
MLHVGPYDQVGETIEAMQSFTEEQGQAFTGKHHEIYLSDPRRVAPENLKTIIRRPVE